MMLLILLLMMLLIAGVIADVVQYENATYI